MSRDRLSPRRRRTAANGSGLRRDLARWRKHAQWAWRHFSAAPRWLRIAVIAATVLVLCAATNLVYQVVRKPTEMFFPVAGALDKMPAETWAEYGPLFREYSTAAVTPELLAALAQVEGAGNPLARTYWRWRLTWNPLAIYRARLERRRHVPDDRPGLRRGARQACIRDHAVGPNCWFTGLYSRVLPSHAIELAAVSLDRQVAAILAQRPRHARASLQQRQDLAALIHLCGAGPAKAFARRGFRCSRASAAASTTPPLPRCRQRDAAQFARLAALP